MAPRPAALRPPPQKPPPPPPPSALPMAPLRWSRLADVDRVRVRRPWYLLGLIQFVRIPRGRWFWAGTR